jgi:hypothetical protein
LRNTYLERFDVHVVQKETLYQAASFSTLAALLVFRAIYQVQNWKNFSGSPVVSFEAPYGLLNDSWTGTMVLGGSELTWI